MIKKITLLYFFILFLSYNSIIAQKKLSVKSFDQIDSLVKLSSKKIVVFIHTDWCKYCLKMHQTTFKNEEIIKELNQNFLFISFDAETKEAITFNHQQFNYIPNSSDSGIHELAKALATLNKKVSYPTLCILNSKYEIIFQYNQYLNANQLKNILEKI